MKRAVFPAAGGRPIAALAAIVLAGLAASPVVAEDRTGAAQTHFPGQITAGGGTSGEAMARSAAAPAAKPAQAGANAGQEAVRGQQPGGTGASGTPGIPEGAGGTASGAAMGGATPGAAATKAAPPPGAGSPAVPGASDQAAALKKQQAAAQAEKEKQDLAASMDEVAARWRARAKTNGWETHPPVPVAAAGAQQGGATASPVPIRSEKAGTAPPSADVKDPAKKGK